MIVKACIIIGIPGQTKNSLKKTLNTLEELGVIVRPMIYTKYQCLKSKMSIDEIESFNRKIFNDNDLDITNEQMARLLYHIDEYKNILQ